MIRLFFYIALVLALGFGFAWLADRPGELSIAWQGQQIQMSLMVAVAMVVSLIAAIMIGWWLVRTILASPFIIQRHFRARKRDRGYQALSTGLIAAGAGDAPTALKLTKRAKGLINADQEPLIHLLEVQTALIEGRNDDARKKFEELSEDPETELLGYRGLYLEARRLGADEAARHYADKAAEKAPQLPWAGEAALSARTMERKWDDALALFERQKAAGMYGKDDGNRKKAVLLTARAMDRFDADPGGARSDGQTALKLAANFVPAALVTARALFRENKISRGSSLLEKVWRTHQHPDIAETYINDARLGDSTADELKRARKLEQIRPNNAESLFAVARAALNAHELDLAREKAEAAARLGPREGIYLLLADIEEADSGDQGRVRHWLAQALRAPRDPAWTADGFVSEEWEPISPVSGKLDAFEWKVPVAQLGRTIDHEAPEKAFERAMAGLPPVASAAGGTVMAEDDPVIEATPLGQQDDALESDEAGPTGEDLRADDADEPQVIMAAPSDDALDAATEALEEDPASMEDDEEADDAAPPEIEKDDDEPDEHARAAAFLQHRPDDPGVDDTQESEPKKRFKLF